MEAFYYIAVFAKMQFFKISVILCFSVRFAFIYFFIFLQPTFLSRFWADLHQTRHECVFMHAIETDEGDF